MKKVSVKIKTLFNHGVIFYGIAAILLLVAMISYIQAKKSSALETIDLNSMSRSESTKLNLQVVYTGELNPDDYEGAQSMAATDEHLAVILTPNHGNMNNQGKNKIKLINPVTFEDESAAFGNPAFNMGHANGATYNPLTKKLVVVASTTDNNLYGTYFSVDTTNYHNISVGQQIGTASNAPVHMYGIAYDTDLNRYYTYSDAMTRIMNASTGKATNFIKDAHLQVAQDVAYTPGYIYRVMWEAKGLWEGHPDVSGNYEAWDGVIFQFSSKTGEFAKAYYTNSPACEIESMAVYNGTPYFLFNSCKNGVRVEGGGRYFTIAKATGLLLEKTLFHQFKYSYDLNDGHWTSEPPASSLTGVVGTDVKIVSQKPERQYYDFVGWKVDKPSSSADKIYASGSTYSTAVGTTEADRVFTAQWEEQKYRVLFDANGGTGGPGGTIVGKTHVVSIPTTQPTRLDSTFLGWSTNKNATTAQYHGGDTYTERENVTFYAVWRKNNYTVSFNFNGGRDTTSVLQPITKTVGESINIPIALPSRDNYTFQGWSLSSDGITVDVAPGQTVSYNTNKTLYAVWRVQTYTIHFYAPEASGVPNDITVPKTTASVIIPPNIPVYNQMMTGYKRFVGWKSGSGSDLYHPGDTYSERHDLTLTAVWEMASTEPEYYRLVFDPNGGTGGPEAQTFSKGYIIHQHTISQLVPEKDGYDFAGWSTERTADRIDYGPGSTIIVDHDITLYAVWRTGTITLIYETNTSESIPDSRGAVGSLHVADRVPVREGFTFAGWSINNEEQPSLQPGQLYPWAKSAILFAVWTKNNVMIEFNLKGGSNGPANYEAAPNMNTTLPTTVPKYANHTFRGWSLGSAAESVDYLPGEVMPVGTSAITLYAAWDSFEYTVRFDGNGAKENAPEPITKNGERAQIPATNLTRAGYEFLGWSTDPNATAAEYVAGDYYTGTTDITLYAVWKRAEQGEEIEDDDDPHFTPDTPVDDDVVPPSPSPEPVPVNPKTESFNIVGVFPIMSGAFIAAGILISRFKRR